MGFSINEERLRAKLAAMTDAELSDYIAAQTATAFQTRGMAQEIASFRLEYAKREQANR